MLQLRFNHAVVAATECPLTSPRNSPSRVGEPTRRRACGGRGAQQECHATGRADRGEPSRSRGPAENRAAHKRRAASRSGCAMPASRAARYATCQARFVAFADRCRNTSSYCRSSSCLFQPTPQQLVLSPQARNQLPRFFLKNRLANRESICISSLTSAAQMIPGSSAVEHSTVNR